MKLLKFAIAALVLAGVSAPMVSAQDPAPKQQQHGGPGGAFTPDQRVKRMTENLNLNADQQKKLLAIFQDDQKKIEAIPQDQRREKGRDVLKASEPKVMAILTPEQQTKYKEMMSHRPPQGDHPKSKSSKDKSSSTTTQ